MGKITNVRGLNGEVKVQTWTDHPEDILHLKKVYIESRIYEIQRMNTAGQTVTAKFCGIDDREAAEALRDKVLYAERKMFKLRKGVYFIRELIGLDVIDAVTGEQYGKIVEVFQTGANDVYSVLGKDGRDRLIPAIKDVIVGVDIEKGIMRISPIEGLFEI